MPEASISAVSSHYRTAHFSARLSAQLKCFIEARMRAAGIDDIACGHGDVLVVLFAHPGATMSDIARASGRTKATITALVKKLEAAGCVRRTANAGDARSSRVELTARGESLRGLFESISAQMDAALESALGADNVRELDRLLALACRRLAGDAGTGP